MGYQSLGPRHYGHWKRKDVLGPSGGRLGLSRSVEGSLSHQIQQLLPVLMGARDYRGAAGVLSVIYTHLMSDPAACVTTSLEILRRLPDSTPTLVEFYQSLLEWQSDHISNDVILRERFLLYLLQGDLHEAYAYYKEHMQLEVLQQDIHVIASFGMVCYWLLFREDQAIRDAYIHAPLSSQSNDDGDNDDIMDNDQETQFPIRHVVGTATLYQEASVSFRRAMTLSPESNVFVEYYVQILVMKNDIELAADYLEHFYHLHPTEPHACRMLFEFFQRYFPASVACHVDICIRWNTLDPSTLVPLKALVECFAQDLVTKGQLVASLCHSLDHCGSNMYQQLHPDTTLWIWQQLADVLGPVSLPPLSQHVALYFEPRQWWRRVYTTNTSSANELTLLNVLQCIVFVRVWGVEALSHTLELATLVHSPHHDVATLATRFHLDSLTRQPTRQPASPSSLKCIGLPVVRTLSQPLSWRPSIGQLRTPHMLKRPQVLTSFELEDAVQVHQVATGAAPPPCRIPRPVNNTIDARVTLESSQSKHQQQHPMDWLLGQRSRQTNPWHMDMTSSVLHAIQTDTSSSSTGGLVLTDKDCFAAAMEDELLLVSPPSTAPLHHLHTSYLYKCLPVPPSSQQAGIVVKALRRYHPFLPQYRIPARFLHWIQHYMMRHGLHATPPKCLEHVESKWRRQYGRCRGLPSIEAVAAAMDYFKRNPVILPRRIRDRFRAFVSAHGRVNLLHLCRVFYTLLGARYPPDLPFSSVLVATARQWMQDGDPRGSVGTALACYPPPLRNRNDDADNAWTRALNEDPPVTESSFLVPANERYLSSIREWLEKEAPISNAALMYYMHMHFDATDPAFPSSNVVTAMIEYVRVQVHAEFADVPSLEDSIYYSLPHRTSKPAHRRYLETVVLPRQPFMPFEDVCRVMLDKTKLPPSKYPAPTVPELYAWWRAAVKDFVTAGMGLGTVVPHVDEAEAALPPPPPTARGDGIEIAKQKLKMLNLPDDMEIFPI